MLKGLGATFATGVLFALSGCAGSQTATESDGRRTVVTDIYPTTFAVQQVVGDAVEVIQLTPAGVEPHDYELTPTQVRQIADADLAMYLPGLNPAVESAIKQEAPDRAVDVASGIARIGAGADTDPHVWLDPNNMTMMGANAAEAIARLAVATHPTRLAAEMGSLVTAGRALESCAIKSMVVAHSAFGYLAQTHGLTQVGISGLSPESEPSPARLAEIAKLVKSEGVTTIYFERLLPAQASETIALETGAVTALLDPIEGNSDDLGYLALMKSNIKALEAGQSCA